MAQNNALVQAAIAAIAAGEELTPAQQDAFDAHTAQQQLLQQQQQQQQQQQANQGQAPGNNNLAAWLNDEFLNGECFVSGEVGELEQILNHRIIVFATDSPSAATPGAAVTFTAAQAELFMRINYWTLAQAKPTLPPVDLAKIAFLRFLAARTGLVSPQFDPRNNNVKYNEAVRLDATETVRAVAAAPPSIRAHLSHDAMRPLQRDFSNIVCAIAFMFRVRGHHYLEDMRTKYADLWKRCQKNADHPGVTWDLLAHDTFHAIMPAHLDAYWVQCSEEGKIAGALVKRLDSAPAGVAAIRAVYAGAQDLRMAIPQIYLRFQAHFDELEDLVTTLKANRWAGSINRRFYGPEAVAVKFNEQRFGAIASVIVKCLDAFAPTSPLLQSKALVRIAENSPITGGFISTGIAALAKDIEMTRAMLALPPTTQ